MIQDETDLSPERKWLHDRWANVVISNLKKRHINAELTPDRTSALPIILGMIPEGTTVVRGDSVTIDQVGVLPELSRRGLNKIIDPFARDSSGKPLLSWEERLKMLREAFTADIFLTGINALTLDGKIISTDALGNRVAATIFGPAKVIVVVGVNKIVRDLDAAFNRIHEIAAPINAKRHTTRHHISEYSALACVQTGRCVDCSSEWKLCCNTVVIEGVFARAKGRINVVLIGEELGI